MSKGFPGTRGVVLFSFLRSRITCQVGAKLTKSINERGKINSIATGKAKIEAQTKTRTNIMVEANTIPEP